ncbi:hypothetical protein AUEXF2481DRAFT_8405 [Aureobasidium subglaciale EXF-2481]|uniref:Uncharacterized protein n=1 Tax=Aureobasidium subglaciale (strain EXF-2481) TaxID=1043005 RepID=A0A074YXG6_AURSE|nr:uncharacterized protein AUEXF2481DRAFT_8405 [Aureobasidium subglaciale EXF-2481]KEQ91531.1 hypothetical protein AUEXF2481DRAFT_8405 [Aureobasidium subglaciale EXF-2481]
MANFAIPRMWLSVTTPAPVLAVRQVVVPRDAWLGSNCPFAPDKIKWKSRDLIISDEYLAKPEKTSGDWLDDLESQISDEFRDHESEDGKADDSEDESIDATTSESTVVKDTYNQGTAFIVKKKSTERR